MFYHVLKGITYVEYILHNNIFSLILNIEVPTVLSIGENGFKNQIQFCQVYLRVDCDNDHNLIMLICEFQYKKLQQPKHIKSNIM